MNIETVIKTAIAAVKEFFEPAGKAWVILPRAGRSLLIAVGIYVVIWILSSIPSLITPLIGIGLLWIASYVFLAKKDKPEEKETDVSSLGGELGS